MRIHQDPQIIAPQGIIQQTDTSNINAAISTAQILNVGGVITVSASNILNISGTVEVPITIVNSDGTLSNVTEHDIETAAIITTNVSNVEQVGVVNSNPDLDESAKVCQTIDSTILRYQTISNLAIN